MPTPSEQKALAFIAIVALLGGAVRVVRANSAPAPTPQQQQALARQATAAETAAVRDKAKKSNRKTKLSADTTPNVVAGVSSVSRFGYPPPGPRVDTDSRAGKPSGGSAPGSDLVDLDVATAAEIERLPRIGPAMARKIVANRDSLGPFKNLESLRRVKGMGPATLKLLADRVAFSGARASTR